jgi:hypothetical protein
MKRLVLKRDKSSKTEMQGTLRLGSVTLYSMERPWIPSAPGGKPNESCVPAGVYALVPHTRPNGDEVVALLNPGLGVYYLPEDRPEGVGRYLILIHAGNWVKDVVGCIAPGIARAGSPGGPMVTSSRDAVRKVMSFIGEHPAEIEIQRSEDYG